MISFTSSGAPTEWVHKTGAWDAELHPVRQSSGRAFRAADPRSHLHFGGIVPGIRADVVERHFEQVRAAVAKYF